jgi:hypothetical protein
VYLPSDNWQLNRVLPSLGVVVGGTVVDEPDDEPDVVGTTTSSLPARTREFPIKQHKPKLVKTRNLSVCDGINLRRLLA